LNEMSAFEQTSIAVYPDRTYLIASTPNAGSSFLARVLAGTELAGRPEEYFRPSGGPWAKAWGVNRKSGDYRRYVEAALSRATSPNGVFGATVQWEHFAWLYRALRPVEDGIEQEDPARLMDRVFARPQYVHLRRRDTIRQAIDYFERIHSGKHRESPTAGALTPRPSGTDLLYVRWLEDLVVDHDRRWSQYFENAGIKPLELYYEDLLDDWRLVVRKTLAYLELERPPGGIRPAGRRPRPDLGWSATWAAPYRDQRHLLPERTPDPSWVTRDRLEERSRPPGPKAIVTKASTEEDVLYSCVTDRVPSLRYQTLVWCLTLIHLAGRSPDCLVVHAVEGTVGDHLKELRNLGVTVVMVQRYHESNPFANKFRQLDSPALRDCDRVVFCDCDLAFVSDISAEIYGDMIGTKVVDAGFPRYQTWVQLAALAGVKGPLEPRRSTQGLRWTYANNINGGFVVVPRIWLPPLAEAWPRWFRWTLEHGQAFAARTKVVRHAFQVAFGLAVLELGLPVRQLSPVLNFSTLPPHDDGDIQGTDPLVLHYHRRMDEDGLVRPTGRPGTDRAIAAVNNFLSLTDQRITTAAALREWNESRSNP
jgi:LPS sulfotransferase NodH